jgi:glycosyltransferase involved in cell wall biosynthesis
MLRDVKFSVVIPCYNQGPFLHECLESLRRQRLPAAEVIVVDDGSTDPFTVARIDELCVPPVKLVRQPNRGLSAARNAGVDVATGDWILPLDADDELTPDALQRYAEAITADPSIDIWYPDIAQFGLDHEVLTQPEFDPWRLLWNNHLVCSAAIML